LTWDGGAQQGDRAGVARRLIVQGVVQGVGFRAATRRMALQLHLRGWVRNLADGSVEVVAVGPEPAVRRLQEWCRDGPPAARVRTVREYPIDDPGLASTLRSFVISR